MSTELAAVYISRMVSRESGYVGQENAVKAIGRKIGMDYWPTYRLMKGAVKTVSIETFGKIRGAYLDYCQRQIEILQREIDQAGGGSNDGFEDLVAEVEALSARIKAAKQRR
ncbi:hypothetical protein [Allorhizobium ampelinum]|uniref:hypothetical protein n=1 Tax=Allorhizobium ampelinum TaxID=3025782 RepID=UPI000B3FAA96|nr:hypothetical protein [Allorhizobium ampelinum]NTA27432.1 hypothetical protein [Allorhizobium ampelinum]OVE94489.1 hypothetical protein B7W85_13130 [Allorhizobium ampelinum]